MIFIRADANAEIGSGHVMRCLAVAAELKKKGEQVRFILAQDTAAGLLLQNGQPYEVLHSDYRDMEAELPALKRLTERDKPACILVDSYFVTPAYLEELGKWTKTAYMDDVAAFSYPVDMVINYNIFGDLLPYREMAHERTKEFLLGVSYVPLRAEFQKPVCEVREEARHILITTGGSDTYNLAGQLLRVLLADEKTKKMEYHVVSGAFNPHLPFLKEMEALYGQVHIHQKVTNMSELMRKCEAAITAAGSTMYELCAMGIPMLCFAFADNQKRMVETFVDQGLVHFGCDYDKEGERMPERVKEKLCELTASKELRQQYSEKARLLVDGRGAARIAEAVRHIE